MTPRLFALVVAGFLVGEGALHADPKIPPLPKDAQKLGTQVKKFPIVNAAYLVLDIVDHFTAYESSTKMRTTLRGVRSEATLTAETRNIDVEMSRTHTTWYGEVTHRMTVPTDVSYTFDLNKMYADPKAFQYDAKRKLLVVTAPPVEVNKVVPKYTDAQITTEAGPLRSKSYGRELELQMIKEDFQGAAKQKGEQYMEEARKAGKVQLKKFLEEVMRTVDKEILVEVR